MKINFQTSGGFAPVPALSKPLTIDTEQIDPQLADQLESIVHKSRFFEQPAQIGNTKKGAADYKTYTITIEDGPNIHTLQLTDPITDGNLHQLVAQLRNLPRPQTGGK